MILGEMMEDKRIHILRDMPIPKALMKLSLPAIISFIVMALYNIADTMFISMWNWRGAGAIQVLFPVMMIASSIGLALGIGGGSYISRLLGSGNKEKANTVFSTSLITGIVVALIYVSTGLFFLSDIVVLFGANGSIIDLAIDYGFYIIIGGLFVITSMILNNSLRAEGSAKFSMLGMVTGTILNIILDPIFIFVLDLGLKGAAMATIISQAVSVSILLQFYLRHKTVVRLGFSYFRLNLEIYKEVLKIGMPTFFRQILFSIAMGVLNSSAMMTGGEPLLSAMGIAIKVAGMPLFFIFGMGQGLQPIVGYNFGAKNKKRLLRAQKHGMKVTFIGAFVSTILLFILAKPIMYAFTDEKLVFIYGYKTIRAMAYGLSFTAVSNTIAVVYQAIGNARVALILSILRQGILLIPSISILSRIFMQTGVIYAQFSADVLTFIISLLIYIPFVKKEKELLN